MQVTEVGMSFRASGLLHYVALDLTYDWRVNRGVRSPDWVLDGPGNGEEEAVSQCAVAGLTPASGMQAHARDMNAIGEIVSTASGRYKRRGLRRYINQPAQTPGYIQVDLIPYII